MNTHTHTASVPVCEGSGWTVCCLPEFLQDEAITAVFIYVSRVRITGGIGGV